MYISDTVRILEQDEREFVEREARRSFVQSIQVWSNGTLVLIDNSKDKWWPTTVVSKEDDAR